MSEQTNNTVISETDENGQPKTAKQLEKEAKKAAKLQKLQEKLEKKATVTNTTKEKAEVRLLLLLSVDNCTLRLNACIGKFEFSE